MSESSEAPQINATTTVEGNNVEMEPAPAKTPKRTPSKRMSFVERAQAESEQLLKSMGIPIEGGTPGRRTRSGGARSSPVVPVESPAKRAKTTPRKPRGKKLVDEIPPEEEKDEEKPESENSVAKNDEVEEKVEEEKAEEEEKQEEKSSVDGAIPETIPEVPEEKQVSSTNVEEKAEKPEEEKEEPMEVDSSSVAAVEDTVPEPSPPVPEVQETPQEIPEEQPKEENNTVAVQENELNSVTEEIKQQNEINSNEELKVSQNDVPVTTPVTASAEDKPKETAEENNHSDLVQTPQSCN